MKRLTPHLYLWEKKGWPEFTWDHSLLLKPLSQARMSQGQLHQAVSSLGFDEALNSEATILIEETLTTAAIEGEKLDKEAIRSSVARRLGLPTAGFPNPDRNIEGLVDILQDALKSHDQPLTLKKMKTWQAALFPTGYSGLYKVRTGNFRGDNPMRVVSGPIGREKIHFEAPPSIKLSKEMKQFVQWWNKGSRHMDGLLRAGVAHLYFVTVHPFEDGNGRIARALTDMALAQDEKLFRRHTSMSARIMIERKSYYEILELDITPWLVWFLQTFNSALMDSMKLISEVLDKAHFWKLHTNTDINGRQRKVINNIWEIGLDQFKGNLTTRQYSGMTKTSRATAFRELSDLVEKGILQQIGSGRSVSYKIIFSKKN
jgi:Fic family protein